MFAINLRLSGQSRFQHFLATVKRILFIGSLVITLSATLAVVAPPTSVYAAPDAATSHRQSSNRQDRRPDRERPVVTSTSAPSGGTTQQGSTATTHARPRLVRR